MSKGSREQTSRGTRAQPEREPAQERMAEQRPVSSPRVPGMPIEGVTQLSRLAAASPASAARAARRMQRRHGNAVVARAARHAAIVQPKLVVTAPGDQYEQEADRAAAQAQLTATQPDSAQRQALSPVGPGAAPDAGVSATPEVEAGIQAARGGGQPLPEGLRGQMEGALGADFGAVVIHDDTRADVLNRMLQARAFTTGRDIFFRQGEYSPSSAGGRALLAHELAHVMQQQMYTHTSTGDDQQSPEGMLHSLSMFRARTEAVPTNIVQRAGLLDNPPGSREGETEAAAKVRRAIEFISREYIILKREAYNWQTLLRFIGTNAVQVVKKLRTDYPRFDPSARELFRRFVVDIDTTIKEILKIAKLHKYIERSLDSAINTDLAEITHHWSELGKILGVEGMQKYGILSQHIGSIRERRAQLAEIIGEFSAKTLPNTINLEAVRQKLLQLTNQMRKENGNLSALTRDSRLDAAAQAHATYLGITKKPLSHIGERNTLPADRMREAGYPYQGSRGLENAVNYQQSPEAAIKKWMNSPDHRANILNPGHRLAGFGFVAIDPVFHGYGYYVQVFD
jgi:uncharacterized protein YkwD